MCSLLYTSAYNVQLHTVSLTTFCSIINKTIVRRWLKRQQWLFPWLVNILSDSKHCCPSLSQAMLHAQPSTFSFFFPQVLWPCGKCLQLGLGRNRLSYVQETCGEGEREQSGPPGEGSAERACESYSNCPLAAPPHCATLHTSSTEHVNVNVFLRKMIVHRP